MTKTTISIIALSFMVLSGCAQKSESTTKVSAKKASSKLGADIMSESDYKKLNGIKSPVEPIRPVAKKIPAGDFKMEPVVPKMVPPIDPIPYKSEVSKVEEKVENTIESVSTTKEEVLSEISTLEENAELEAIVQPVINK